MLMKTLNGRRPGSIGRALASAKGRPPEEAGVPLFSDFMERLTDSLLPFPDLLILYFFGYSLRGPNPDGALKGACSLFIFIFVNV